MFFFLIKNAIYTKYLFVVYILFYPVIRTSIHLRVNNSHDIKVLMKVIKTKTFNVGFKSQ